MSLSEEDFTRIVEAGCSACRGEELTIRAYVKARFLLLDGEAYGAPKFIYKGEELTKGTFRVECATCKHLEYESGVCPKCGAADGVASALESPDAHAPRPTACPGCRDEQVGYVVWIPVMVKSHGGRPEKARTLTTLDDDGCHGVQVECKECLYLQVVPSAGACGLCGSAN